MKPAPTVTAALAIAVVALLAGSAQERPVGGGRSAVLNLRECMDKARNHWITDIEVELQKVQEADSGRATDLNPQERLRIRTKNIDAGNRRKLEVYAEIVRISGALAKERGFDLVQRVDRVPSLESGDADFLGKLDGRAILQYDPSIDLTSAVLEQINKDYSVRKR
ncbi:MAG TPA: hypothetical protein VE981_05105 [Planctomycetota bacterium]|nr:hypothetical protein [Planctomycetota bacterium]